MNICSWQVLPKMIKGIHNLENMVVVFKQKNVG